MLHYETISGHMRDVAGSIFESLDPDYYLAGGTALALQIGHRKSIDLDYFIAKDIDTAVLRGKIEELFSGSAIEILFEEKNTLWCRIDDIKVSFITRKDVLIEPLIVEDQFRLAGTRDLTVMKLSAICGREEYKDYYDLACLAKDKDARTWVSLWSQVYPHVDPTSWLVALAAVDDVVKIPLDILPAYGAVEVPTTVSAIVRDITKYITTQPDSSPS